MMVEKAELDPWRVIRSFLANVISREVPDIIDRTGLPVDWSLTEREDYSHAYRWAAYRPRIDAAYATLGEDDQLRIAFIIAGELSNRGLEDELSEALRRIGWELKGGRLLAVGETVRELFFPDGSHHDAYVRIRAILASARASVDFVDPYVDATTLTLLSTCAKPGMGFKILTSKYPADFALEADKWRNQNRDKSLEIRTTTEFHDRFVVLDQSQCWHIGASIKDAGKKVFMVSQIEDEANRLALLAQIQASWNKGSNL